MTLGNISPGVTPILRGDILKTDWLVDFAHPACNNARS